MRLSGSKWALDSCLLHRFIYIRIWMVVSIRDSKKKWCCSYVFYILPVERIHFRLWEKESFFLCIIQDSEHCSLPGKHHLFSNSYIYSRCIILKQILLKKEAHFQKHGLDQNGGVATVFCQVLSLWHTQDTAPAARPLCRSVTGRLRQLQVGAQWLFSEYSPPSHQSCSHFILVTTLTSQAFTQSKHTEKDTPLSFWR